MKLSSWVTTNEKPRVSSFSCHSTLHGEEIKNFVVVIFGVWIFGLLQDSPINLTFTFSTTANTTATARDPIGSAPSASSSAMGRKRRDAPCRPCQLHHERRARVPVRRFRLKLSKPHHSSHQGEHYQPPLFLYNHFIHPYVHSFHMPVPPG